MLNFLVRRSWQIRCSKPLMLLKSWSTPTLQMTSAVPAAAKAAATVAVPVDQHNQTMDLEFAVEKALAAAAVEGTG